MKTNLIKERIDDAVNSGVVSGISASIITKDGNEYYLKGKRGVIEPYNTLDLDTNLQYDMASCTKVVATTTKAMQLIESGKLNLEDRVVDYLERFRFPEVKVKNLLLHNAGFPSDMPDKASLTKENIIDRIYAMDIINKPGEVMAYSDIGFILLGFIIMEIEKADLSAIYARDVLKPLNMTNSTYHPDVKRCLPEEITEKRGVIIGECHDSKGYLLADKCASAGLFSTIEDITKFSRAMLYGEGNILKKETIDLLVKTDVLKRSYGWDKKYGDGILYHTGFTGTSIFLDYRKNEALVMLTNRIHPKRDNQKFIDWRNDLNDELVRDL